MEANRALKAWLSADSHLKWEGLELEWKQGHNPELHVGDKHVDLNGADEDRMRDLLKEHGFEEEGSTDFGSAEL